MKKVAWIAIVILLAVCRGVLCLRPLRDEGRPVPRARGR